MDRISAVRKRRSGDIARKRLKFLLITDRTGIAPEILDMLKRDLYRVISRYMDVEPGELEVIVKNVSAREDAGILPVLYTRIPIKNLNCKGTF